MKKANAWPTSTSGYELWIPDWGGSGGLFNFTAGYDVTTYVKVWSVSSSGMLSSGAPGDSCSSPKRGIMDRSGTPMTIMEEITKIWSNWVKSGEYPSLQGWLDWYRGTTMPHQEDVKTYLDFPQYDLGILDNPPRTVQACWSLTHSLLDHFIEALRARNLEALFWYGLQGLLVRSIGNLWLDQPVSPEQYATVAEASQYSQDSNLPASASLDDRYNELISMTEYGKQILQRQDLPDLDYTLGIAILKFHQLFVFSLEQEQVNR
jgi:hypothetical protein